MRARVAVALALLVVSHGASAAPAERPFDPTAFFAGSTRSAGLLTDGFGRPTSRFTGRTRGRRERDGATVFDQEIRFDDGSVRSRRWQVIRTGPDTIEATGTDIVGTARGTIAGRTLHLVSTIRVTEGNPLTDVDFDQVMDLQPDGRRLTNRSTVTKLGLVLRRVEETFVRTGAAR